MVVSIQPDECDEYRSKTSSSLNIAKLASASSSNLDYIRNSLWMLYGLTSDVHRPLALVSSKAEPTIGSTRRRTISRILARLPTPASTLVSHACFPRPLLALPSQGLQSFRTRILNHFVRWLVDLQAESVAMTLLLGLQKPRTLLGLLKQGLFLDNLPWTLCSRTI